MTASWVTKDNSLIPFPDRFPKQAQLLKSAKEEGIIEICNHGLTHCVVGEHLPRAFSSNRSSHREFWDYLPQETHDEHLRLSQQIFFDWLGESPKTLIPPGNVYSGKTVLAAEKFGITRINSVKQVSEPFSIKLIKDGIDAFHDRELVLFGTAWLRHKILVCKEKNLSFAFLADLP